MNHLKYLRTGLIILAVMVACVAVVVGLAVGSLATSHPAVQVGCIAGWALIFAWFIGLVVELTKSGNIRIDGPL